MRATPTLPPAMLFAVAKVESNLAQNATSSAGARGLLQVMPATARALNLDPDEPRTNMLAGARYLRQLSTASTTPTSRSPRTTPARPPSRVAGGAPSDRRRSLCRQRERGMARARRLPLAALALLALAGCGSRQAAPPQEHAAAARRSSSRRRGPRTEAKPTQKLDASKTYDVVARRRTAAASRSSSPRRPRRRRPRRSRASSARASSTHRLPPDHPRVRRPGRRPDRQRQRRPRLLDRRPAARLDAVHARRRRDGEDRERGGRHARAASSSSSPRRTRSCRRTTRCSEGRQGPAVVRPDRAARRPGGSGTPTAIVEIEKATVTSVSAVVLAAGASSRYGGVKQREFLPAVLAALARVVGRRGRRRRRRAIRSTRRARGSSTARTGSAGPGASLRCGLEALGARRDARGGRARGRARARPARGRPRSPPTRRRSPPRPTTASASHPVALARSAWGAIPDEGGRALEPELVDCSDLDPPGDRDRTPIRRRVNAPMLELAHTLDAVPQPSPLREARERRELTPRAVALRSGLTEEQIEWLEEGRIYRFPSQSAAIMAAVVYATAIGVDRAEARRLAGLPVGRTIGVNAKARLAAVGLVAALLSALAVMVARPEPAADAHAHPHGRGDPEREPAGAVEAPDQRRERQRRHRAGRVRSQAGSARWATRSRTSAAPTGSRTRRPTVFYGPGGQAIGAAPRAPARRRAEEAPGPEDDAAARDRRPEDPRDASVSLERRAQRRELRPSARATSAR